METGNSSIWAVIRWRDGSAAVLRHATADLFRGAHYILTPDADVPQESIHLLEQLVTFMGCADVVFSDLRRTTSGSPTPAS